MANEHHRCVQENHELGAVLHTANYPMDHENDEFYGCQPNKSLITLLRFRQQPLANFRFTSVILFLVFLL